MAAVRILVGKFSHTGKTQPLSQALSARAAVFYSQHGSAGSIWVQQRQGKLYPHNIKSLMWSFLSDSQLLLLNFHSYFQQLG